MQKTNGPIFNLSIFLGAFEVLVRVPKACELRRYLLILVMLRLLFVIFRAKEFKAEEMFYYLVEMHNDCVC